MDIINQFALYYFIVNLIGLIVGSIFIKMSYEKKINVELILSMLIFGYFLKNIIQLYLIIY